MFSGSLDRRITFQTRTTVKNSYGERKETFTNSFTVWGNPMELKGKEKYQANQLQAKADIQVNVRYREDITEDMRITYTQRGTIRTFDIFSISEINRDDGLMIFAMQKNVT